ncbi:MAG: NADH-quinone oxidoreductase subunit NuoG [Trueperaceae bacterium]
MKVKVNDVELDLKPGTSAIDAVFAAGYDVPYFCSQEYMSPIGACRMCLAKAGSPRKNPDGSWVMDEATGQPKIFYFPNPIATCVTAISEGMIIDTLAPESVAAQRGMVEMTLINHPLDCPTCDKGGACELQDRAYEYGSGMSRFEFDKRHQEKHHALSELITLDRERCIHCKRCVRYFEEVPGDEVLDFIERGGHTYIGTIDDGMPSNFTGNITDICPVGALLDATSRFRGRNWEYDHTRSTSLDDASGSAITIDARTGRIERIKAALNTKVNKTWIDDGIRFGHEYVDSPDRIKTPLIRKDGKLEAATWEEAAAFVVSKMSKDTGIVLRADATLEEGFAAKSLAEFYKANVDHFPRYAASVIPQNPATIEDVATSDALFVIADVTEEIPALDLRIKDALKGTPIPELMPHGVPIADLRLKEHAPRKKQILTVAAPYHVDLMNHAGRSVVVGAQGPAPLLEALVKIAGGEAVDTSSLALKTEDAQALVKQLTEAKNSVIICGGFVLSSSEAAKAAETLAKVTNSKQMNLGAMANSYGLESLGVVSKGYSELLNSKSLIVSGLNPAQDASVAEKLKGLELFVVHDMFHNETTELAHVVLPAKSGYEKDGTVVNLEGRYLSVHAAPVEGGQSEDFTGVVKYIADAKEIKLEGRSVRSSQRAMKKAGEVDLSELPEEGIIAKAKKPVAHVGARAPSPLQQNGNVIVAPSMIRAEYISRNPHLRAAHGGAKLSIHPTDAAFHNLRQDDVVSLNVGGLIRKLQVQITDALPGGMMSVPAIPEQPVGVVNADMSSLKKEQVALLTNPLEVA